MKRFFKKAAALSLSCLMVAGLAACGNSGSGSSAPAGGTESSGSAKSGDIVKLVVWGNGSADTEDCNEVAEAVSKITREKIGVEIELVRGQDAEQINLALTSGEPIDLLCYNNISGQLATVVRNNWAYPLDDLVQQYGQGALGVINEYDLDACRANGKLVALPTRRILPVQQVLLCVRISAMNLESQFLSTAHTMICTRSLLRFTKLILSFMHLFLHGHRVVCRQQCL